MSARSASIGDAPRRSGTAAGPASRKPDDTVRQMPQTTAEAGTDSSTESTDAPESREVLGSPGDRGSAAQRVPYTLTFPPTRHLALRAMRFGWVPLVAAMLSLVLSIASIYVATRQPDVLLLMPSVVRLAGGHATGYSYVYLQPAFVSTGNNDRVEVIRDMSLTVRQEGGGEPVDLAWKGQGELVGSGGTLSYAYTGDAVPLLVSPRTASAPLSLFEAPAGWFFGPDTYEFTFAANRVMASEPLRAAFTVTITPDDAAILGGIPERFLPYPI